MRLFLRGHRWTGSLLIALSLILGQPTSVTAASQLTLTWSDRSTNEAGFKIERKTGTTGTYAQVAQVVANITSFLDSTVTAGTTYCYRVRAFNSAGNSAYSNEACGAPATTPQSFTLTVTRTGTGAGTVTSNPVGITCGTDCSQSYTSTTSVTLSAAPASGSVFSGWGGGGCSGTGPCTLMLNTNTSVKATFATATTPPPSTNDWVAAYGFNQGSGTTAADSSGHGLTGTLKGATWTTWGKYSNALAFNGSSAYVALGNWNITGRALTFTAWVRATDWKSTADVRILAKATGTQEQEHWWMLSESNGKPRFRLKAGDSTSTLVGASTLPLNTWVHLAATYDGATMRIYQNGVLVGSRTKTGQIESGTAAINIGRNPVGEHYFSGIIDEVRIYNRALTAAQITTDMKTATVTTNSILSVTRVGSGTVTSSPAGITCGTDCSQSYTSTTSVTLSAAPASGSVFSGWSGGGCSGTGPCTLMLNTSTSTSVKATFATATTPPPSTNKLVVAYGFNEGSGTTVADVSGNKRTGTISGSGVTWTTGKYGAALAFTSSTARVTSGLTTHATVRSYTLWTLRTGDGGSGLGRMFDKHTTGREVEILKNNAAANAYTYERAWSGQTASWSIPRPSANVWHHIAVIYDASSAANNPRIYVDGVAQPVTRTRAPSGSPLTNTDRYVLGNRGAGDRGWKGKLDNLRIYNRALTAAEIVTDRATAVTP